MQSTSGCMKPSCASSGTYSEAASDILNEAARDFSVAQFRRNEGLRARFELYQRRALWATLVARQVAANASMADDVPNLDEQIGNILYEDLQNAPPLCDQLSTVYLTQCWAPSSAVERGTCTWQV